ncbi:MAG TPA: 2-dehydropantoate 2-reductase [Firmicutes bacterium]|jgi:2-dehydropantoate 2-reductase|nr:2-dehydropantoate 2-reductase [Bacillota bacterium]
MKKIEKVLLSGLGAIGSAFASKLFDSDPEILKVIADPVRIEKYQKNGVTVNDKSYSFQFCKPGSSTGPADLILIAVKQHNLAQSIQDISGFIGENTIILSLLNGITSEEIIGEKYGHEKLLLSFVVGTDAVREGTHTHFSNIGKIVFGEVKNTTDLSKVKAIQELFDRTQIPYSIPEDMQRELWWKYMMNVGINQTSAVLGAPYGVFQKIGEARELMEMASMEVITLAEKRGINLTKEDIQRYVAVINTLAPDGKTSMLQDIEAGRKTEVEIFSGTIIELGLQFGIETPVNQILYRMIRTLELQQKLLYN